MSRKSKLPSIKNDMLITLKQFSYVLLNTLKSLSVWLFSALLFSYPFYLVWNSAFVNIFDTQHLTWAQSFYLLCMLRIVYGCIVYDNVGHTNSALRK